MNLPNKYASGVVFALCFTSLCGWSQQIVPKISAESTSLVQGEPLIVETIFEAPSAATLDLGWNRIGGFTVEVKRRGSAERTGASILGAKSESVSTLTLPEKVQLASGKAYTQRLIISANSFKSAGDYELYISIDKAKNPDLNISEPTRACSHYCKDLLLISR
jgi:hypothetical protein